MYLAAEHLAATIVHRTVQEGISHLISARNSRSARLDILTFQDRARENESEN